MKKKLLLLMVVLTIAINNIYFASNVYATEIIFKDVDQKHWAAKEIQYLSEQNVIQGNPDGNFAPNDKLTRLQIALMVTRAKGYSVIDRPDPQLVDVKNEDVYFDIISAAMAEGVFDDVVKGHEFKPNAFVTRAEMSSILSRAFELSDISSVEFKDVTTNSWAYSSIQALVKNEIVFGFADGTFKPERFLSRAEFAVMMARLLDETYRVAPEPKAQVPVEEPEKKPQLNKMYITVPIVKQKPELPNGCEITSLTAVLNYYGFSTSKMEMANNYLPKESFTYQNNKRYGPNPYKAYAGDPRLGTGFFSYAPPIVAAAENLFVGRTTKYTATDVSGKGKEFFYEKINNNVPVVIWVTLDLSTPKVSYSWYFSDTKEYFKAPINLHAVVLVGYNEFNNTVHLMDPLKGRVSQNADKFFQSYKELGSHAMIVERNK
ncbi:S-layer homology domain-containing protein [Lysinibacillus sp. NPDC056232]|uniref:S-layer homology domain-containing protein n=1 Tax=Lysinibacillus sp. NPDC056232 TaxID=3345756 RepID=UPI0035D5B813